ncbi:hypothetical protein [Bradyrhizobium uaiense]|uniref:Uncharacterized protein n=1 Tax=Bradyrhizobium uaiense TaxID=2594946 RepID=A0A6P1BD07_9BRAD|nr:hypothetical protein [Bradyrhizobium uaiense]NEU96034.1 hypothetical protein [Bradyrhizobium uaiense]
MLANTQEELQAASYAALRAHATSERAQALVAKLASMVEEKTIQIGLRQRKRRGAAASAKLEYATGAFLADLLRPFDAEQHSGWVYKSLSKASFTGAPVGRHAFFQLRDGLEGLGFLQHVPGHKVSGERSDVGQYAARFRATQELLKFCTEQGVPPKAVLDHFEFEYDLPKHPVELRKRKLKNFYRRTDVPGAPMEFERTPSIRGMEHVISELNEFFAKHTLRGGQHHGYVRIFHNGDDPDFDWDKGGRLYSQHFADSYQVMSSEDRRKMTIDGEPVAEVDISGSYLTIFLSLHGLQLDLTEDPYLLPGLGVEHRGAVKQWFVGTFGNNKPIKRWPKDMLDDDPTLAEHRAADITKAVFVKYPVLKSWGEPCNGRTYSWADLMYLESAVMFSTMLGLMHEHSTPSLSVHDSLIVPVSKVEVASELLRSRFQERQNVLPRLKVNEPINDQV